METQQPHITLLDTSMVLPAIPTHRHHLFLPSLDRFWIGNRHNQRILFYESCPLDQFPSFVSALKNSLSLALVHFFPFAGRLANADDGTLVLDCNDAGVEFVQASIDFPFSGLLRTGFQLEPFFQNLVQLGDLCGLDQLDAPLLSVQVTKFLHGGIALAVSHTHVVADGTCLWHFLVSWSECARGMPISKPPVHTRTALKLDDPSAERAKQYMFGYLFDAAGKEKGKQRNEAEGVRSVDRVFHFSGEMVRRLREEAGEGCTTFEALGAHCWRCVMRARKLEGKVEVHMGMTVNCRKRLDPPLPDNYFGNVVCFTLAFCMAEELRRETLRATSHRLHDAIVSECTHEKITAFMHWLELRRRRLGALNLKGLGVGVTVASSPRFPVYQVDFGLGPPASARPARVGIEGELCVFPGVEGGGSIDVCIRLEEDVMLSLENDPLFLLSS